MTTCTNNCKREDPNSVIIGGTALLATASVGGCVTCCNIKFGGNMLEKTATRNVQDCFFCFWAGWVVTNFVGKGGAGRSIPQ